MKALSISWTSDGGSFGVVPSLEASSLETQLGCGVVSPLPMGLMPVSVIPPCDKLEGCCQARAAAIVVLVAARGWHMAVGWLLAVDRHGWRCLATVNAVWDCVGGRRLRQQHHGSTWLAADCGGLLSLAGPLGAVQRRMMAQATSLARYSGGGR